MLLGTSWGAHEKHVIENLVGTHWEHQYPKKISTHTLPSPVPTHGHPSSPKKGKNYGVHVDRAHEIFILVPIVPSINKMGCFPRFFLFFGLVTISHFDWPITKERTETLNTPPKEKFPCEHKGYSFS